MSRILVVDDEPLMAATYQRLLVSLGHEVLVASDGVAAAAALRGNPPDLVILDIKMPRMDGVELHRLLRSSPTLSEVPVIVVSALAGMDARLDSTDFGADRVLAKPVDPNQFLAAVANALAGRPHKTAV